MKKAMAQYASATLTASARVFATVLKPFANSPEIPQELRK
ncbi:cyclic lactone autoinducer peptide [Paenibacillus rhizophilus]|uniref:Cyclic lactone autoinducer peptide n=1 Tax=Paenibacillus rhizophilus TaxID=1850366 RepID=A0A3N9PQY4_9BACL|nr:cyclic lactone autoinducer peptide [Paenibacillus rhizophilus]RQW08722.1 cyclic lactone autoinducer peptide [Paenibacillus rhizophilus]